LLEDKYEDIKGVITGVTDNAMTKKKTR